MYICPIINQAKLNVMKTVITKDGYKLTIVKVYKEGERFYGKILIRHEGFNVSCRFDKHYFNSIVEDKDKVQ